MQHIGLVTWLTYDLDEKPPPSHEKTGCHYAGRETEATEPNLSLGSHALLTAQELHVSRIFSFNPTPGHNTAGFFKDPQAIKSIFYSYLSK